ncbi:toxin [Bosea sp. AAP35]|uniref:BrnT family toxin n=1 Tax=Bosea sp. AAP35 TaxID=1523417 RepID=UPI0006B9DC22|nr:BrnT family toxin [Bosea sp. AAP35]KPF72542.1 toxin [Bosea sp. AAP35]
MPFEFDPLQSAANLAKHGIDFQQAQALWEDVRLLEAPARTEGELRFMAVGMIGQKHWSAIDVYRGDRVRIISVRRARSEEIDYYENG